MPAQPQPRIIDGDRTVLLHEELHEVTTQDGMRLSVVRTFPAAGTSRSLPVLLLHGFGQNRYTWSLSRRSFEAYLVAAGYEVYNAELRGHGRSLAAGSLLPQTLADLTDFDVPALLRYVIDVSGRERVVLIGHSLGGHGALALPIPRQQHVAGIAALAAPCPSRHTGPVQRAVADALEQLWRWSPWSGQAVFPLRWVGRGVERCLPLLEAQKSPWRMAMWYPQSIERDLLLELLRHGFDQESLGLFWMLLRWTTRTPDAGMEQARLERSAALRAPVLLLAGSHDMLVPPRAVERWLDVLGSPERRFVLCGGETDGLRFGHCDLVVGRQAPRHVWPVVLAWLDELERRKG